MATLALRSVRKEYGKLVALDGLDLDVGDGEFFVLLGPSGAGKTTTLEMCGRARDADCWPRGNRRPRCN